MPNIPSSITFPIVLSIGLSCALGDFSSCRAQTTPPSLTDPLVLPTCPRSQCTLNQSTGTSTSVGVGISSSFGVNSTAQSTSNYNASASASLVLNAFDGSSPSGSVNSSRQSVGDSVTNSPITLKITSEAIQSKSKDGDNSAFLSASNYTSDENSASSAEFDAAGFTAFQDLRFSGGSEAINESIGGSSSDSSGSAFKADVIKILDKTGGPEVGTANSSSGSQSQTRFTADITTSTFVNAFTSSF